MPRVTRNTRSSRPPQPPPSGWMGRLRRFPWWVYAIVLLCVCGGLATVGQRPQTQAIGNQSAASAASTPTDTFAPTPAQVAATGTPAAAPAATDTQSAPAPTQATQVTPTEAQAALQEQPQLTEAQVLKVVDGDTLDISIGGREDTVRIIGVDTPETKDPREPVMCYGAEASAETKRLVDQASGNILLEQDVSERDKYNRLLRYVWLQHPDGQRMLNLELVKAGYAQVSTYPPDVRNQDLFVEAEREAREKSAGLWGACGAFGVPVFTPTAAAARRQPPTATSKPVSSGGGTGGSAGGGDWRSQGLPFDPSGPDRDCSDFSMQAEAQRFFEAAGGPASDRHRLDADRDGIACETLP